MTSPWRISPQQIDPLSWFTRPLIPLSFALLLLVYGAGSILIARPLIANPGWDLVAVGLMVAACLFVQERTKPFRRRFGIGQMTFVVAVCGIAIIISALANQNSELLVQHWWTPAGGALVVATMGPFSSVRRILVAGSTVTTIVAIGGLIAFSGTDGGWPPLSTAVVCVGTAAIGTVATSVFCYTVVSRTRRLLAVSELDERESGRAERDAFEQVERHTLARLGARVAPFLEKIADAGTVTDEDRALAGQLARRLRTDLLERASMSWLDTLAERGRMFVVDPERRADRLSAAQRAALRGLLGTALRNPGTDAGSLFVELRGQDDGSTAVAISLDIEAPEGRRARMIAPYLLALSTTVDDVSYDAHRDLLTFEVRALEL